MRENELTTRTLTVHQPWASLIVAGVKKIENRSWPTNYRGPVNIHAGQTTDPSDWTATLDDIPTGAILGTVNIVDCVRDSTDEFAEAGEWNWVLEDARALDVPVPAKGKLGLWNWKPAS